MVAVALDLRLNTPGPIGPLTAAFVKSPPIVPNSGERPAYTLSDPATFMSGAMTGR